MKKYFTQKLSVLLLAATLSWGSIQAQTFPYPALVGYWETWGSLKLSQIHPSYNVIDIAFAITKGSSLCDMELAALSNYPKVDFLADIDALHVQNKVVILSIGGANDAVLLNSTSDKSTFVTSMNKIFTDHNDKFDGIDIDLEASSLGFPNTWTMTAPVAAQQYLIDAIKEIMAAYKLRTGKKLLLTMAPETHYVHGALSANQIAGKGGAYLPIIEALKNEIDMLHCQLYNAGGATGGNFAIDGVVYYDTGNGDYITAMTESVIKGFTCLNGKGVFSGLPAKKVGFGLPACTGAAGTGYVQPAVVCEAAKYLRGMITKPSGWKYTVTTNYPDLGGMMTWDVNIDKASCGNSFATNFTCAFNTNVGIDELAGTATFNFYPNPATYALTIETNNNAGSLLRIVSVMGQVLLEKEIGQPKTTIDISNLSAGFYTITDGTSVKKFIKQ